MTQDETQAIERQIAEDYRRQRQIVDGERSGFNAVDRTEYLRWLESHTHHLTEIARSNGATEEEAREASERYKKIIRATPAVAPFDDPTALVILERLVREIEGVCLDGQIPIQNSVVFGVSPELGLQALQMPVLTTEVSIITVSAPFLPFCNLLSKTLATSLPHVLEGENYKVSLDPDAVLSRLKSQPAIMSQWALIVSSYAIFGWPPDWTKFPLGVGEHTVSRVLLLRAIEVFAVAHEYGHHVLKHSSEKPEPNVADQFADEHDADAFARVISMAIGFRDSPHNLYAASGSGGAILLATLELIRRAKCVLLTGIEEPELGTTHPPFSERTSHIAQADFHAPEDYRPAFKDMRKCFVFILENIWTELKPIFQRLHDDGVRPTPGAPDVGGWLPLAHLP